MKSVRIRTTALLALLPGLMAPMALDAQQNHRRYNR